MSSLKFLDIAFNATDSMFQGSYHGKQRHAPDLEAVVSRAQAAGVRSSIITGGSLSESKEALRLAEVHNLFCTVGLHPTRSNEMDEDPEGYLRELNALVAEGKWKGRVVAIGECGLDYDRLHFAPKQTQAPHFAAQLSLAFTHALPLFLHSRAAHADFVAIMREHRSKWEAAGGVVHSFTGTVDEMKELVDLGLYVGINGCSLKTEENLAVARELPLDRLMLETDAPYCSMTTSHASHKHAASLPTDLAALYAPSTEKAEKFKEGKAVKGRLEPCGVGRVAWVVAKVKGIEVEEVTKAAWDNTVKVFGLDLNDVDEPPSTAV